MAEKDLDGLRERIRSILREPVAARWKDTDINGYINAVLKSVSRIMEIKKIHTQDITAGTETVSLPEDCLVVSNLYWIDESVNELCRQFITAIPDTLAEDDTGTPSRYWLISDIVYLRPVPDADGTLKIIYYWEMPELVNDSDTPALKGLEEVIVAGAVERAYFEDGDPRYEIWNAKFNKEITEWLAIDLSKYSMGFKVDDAF